MSELLEPYVRLGLHLGRHVDGLVDAYYGPRDLATEVDAEPLRDAGELAAEARALAAAIGADSSLDPRRRAWLEDQLHALGAYAGVLAGDDRSYADEVEACYGVRPEPGSETLYAEAHATLAELLPGNGELRDRYEGWRASEAVTGEQVVPALRDLVGALRRATERVVELPEGEVIELEAVGDEPWWAFNYYLGQRHSRVVVNVDVTTTPGDLVTLAAHEVYPGHHTEHAVKEQLFLDERGWLEESIQLVPTPQALVSEGIAEAGLELLLGDGLQSELSAILARHGLRTDLELAFAVDRARGPLRSVAVDAALMLHEQGRSPAEAQSYVERWGLVSPERAAQTIRFVTDPTWRAYAITYAAGGRLCRDWLRSDPARLRRLLTEQIRVDDLLPGTGTEAGAGGDLPQGQS